MPRPVPASVRLIPEQLELQSVKLHFQLIGHAVPEFAAGIDQILKILFMLPEKLRIRGGILQILSAAFTRAV